MPGDYHFQVLDPMDYRDLSILMVLVVADQNALTRSSWMPFLNLILCLIGRSFEQVEAVLLAAEAAAATSKGEPECTPTPPASSPPANITTQIIIIW